MKTFKHVKVSKIAATIVLIIGIVFIIIAGCFNIYDNKVKKEWLQSTAVIVYINDYDEEILISYTYKENSYINQPSFYSSTFELEDVINISINPNDPNEVYLHDSNILFIVFYCVGGVFLLIGIMLFVVSKLKDNNIKKCLSTGSKKTLKVEEIKRSYTQNNYQTYYYLVVRYKDKVYKSDLFAVNKDFNFTELGVVDLYILENGKYYINLDSYRITELIEF